MWRPSTLCDGTGAGNTSASVPVGDTTAQVVSPAIATQISSVVVVAGQAVMEDVK